jgi:hypothetical protein
MSSGSLLFCLIAPALYAQAPSNPEIRAAAGRSIPVIQRATTGFYKPMSALPATITACRC